MVKGTSGNDRFVVDGTETASKVEGLGGDDTIIAEDQATIGEAKGGEGNDLIEGKDDAVIDAIDGGKGDDEIVLSGDASSDKLETGSGDNEVSLSDNAEVRELKAKKGDDTITLDDDARVTGKFETSGGNDEILLNDRSSIADLDAGKGNDFIRVAEEATADEIDAGSGRDEVVLEGPGVDTVDGGKGEDVLRVPTTGREIRFDPGSDEDGTIVFADGSTTRFEDFETVVCFAASTRVVTASGKRPIGELKVGARVMTLDRGLQPIRWIARTEVPARGALAPIRIPAGALGNTSDLLVSPQHRMLVSSAHAEMLFGASTVLVPAKALIGCNGIERREGGRVAYVHMMFDRHEIVLAEGAPSESFQVGDVGLSAMGAAARDELLALFPELRHRPPACEDARPALRTREAMLLATRMMAA